MIKKDELIKKINKIRLDNKNKWYYFSEKIGENILQIN